MGIASLGETRRRREEEARDKAEAPDGWMSGHAYCTACGHAWDARAPVGTFTLECQSCGTHRGIWRAACTPADGEPWWTCLRCGSPFFYVTPAELCCAGCNAPQKGMWD
jgi:DNA-directed RNA polymerase subunit M/transcription elongation factor TFIIS